MRKFRPVEVDFDVADGHSFYFFIITAFIVVVDVIKTWAGT